MIEASYQIQSLIPFCYSLQEEIYKYGVSLTMRINVTQPNWHAWKS